MSCLHSFASQLKQINFHSIVTHELFFLSVFICLFVWLQVIKRSLKISRNRAVTHMQDRNPQKQKCIPETERKERENILLQQNE